MRRSNPPLPIPNAGKRRLGPHTSSSGSDSGLGLGSPSPRGRGVSGAERNFGCTPPSPFGHHHHHQPHRSTPPTRRAVLGTPRPMKTRTLPSACSTHETELEIDVEVHLERVLGINVQNNAALSCDLNTGAVAYPAGCVVVLYSSKRQRQTFIHNAAKKCITSLQYSRDGKFIVTGETGHQPMVRVWETEDRTCVAEFGGHNFGIRCVSFSPSGRYLVSVGSQHDMMVNVWDWKQRLKIASSKVSSKVNSMAFSEDGHCFLTAGNRHVRFWYMDSSRAKVKETIPLQGRNAILADLKNNNFTDVACGRGANSGKTFVITQAGHLCQFNEKRVLVKWVELKTRSANCLSISDSNIFVGCAAGVVRFFDADTLHYVTTLPRPHVLGVDVAAPPDEPHNCSPNGDEYADVNALTFDSVLQRVTVVYNDHSLYIWDVHDSKKIGKVASHLYHSGCVWGVDTYNTSLSPGSLLKAPSALADQPLLPRDAFVTCSADNTIRVWCLDSHHHSLGTSSITSPRPLESRSISGVPHGNIYSPNLMKILYIDPELVNLCDKEYNPAGTTDKTDTSYEMKQGVRVVKVSPDGLHLASGDREGNIRIHSLETFEELKVIEAHEAEILSLDYFQSNAEPDLILLSSTSRDRLIHVFDPAQDYFVVQTLGDHSAAVFSARLVETTGGDIRMISCGSDKSILIRMLEPNEYGTSAEFFLENHIVGHHSQYDMAVEPSQRYVATACQDRYVRIYNIQTGKQRKAYRGSLAEDGFLLRCALDPSGAYLATTGSDKQLYILDFHTGEVQAQFGGHAELVLGVRFLPDLKHVVSVSADGCIFVWRLPPDMTLHMRHRLKESANASAAAAASSTSLGGDATLTGDSVKPEDFAPGPGVTERVSAPETLPGNIMQLVEATQQRPNNASGDHSGFRFSVSVLPSWAQKKFSRRDSIAQMSANQSADSTPLGDTAAAHGVWAERAEKGGEMGPELPLLPRDADAASLSRRCSLVPVPRIVEDDGSNVEEDAEDEFAQNEHRRDSCCVAHRRASIQSSAVQSMNTSSGPVSSSGGGDTESLQTGSTEEGDEDEEELPVIFFPSSNQEEEEDVGTGSAYPVIAVSPEDDLASSRSNRRPLELTFKSDLQHQDLVTPNSEEDETRDVLEEFDMVLEDHDTDEPLMTRSMEIGSGDAFHDNMFGSCSQLAIQGVSGRESLSRKYLSKQSSPRPALSNITGGKIKQEDPSKRKDSLTRAAEATNRRLQKMASSRSAQQPSSTTRRRSSTQSNVSTSTTATTSKRSTVDESRKQAEESRTKRSVRPAKRDLSKSKQWKSMLDLKDKKSRDPQSARSTTSTTSGVAKTGGGAAVGGQRSSNRSVSSERSSRMPTRSRPSYEQATSASLARSSRAATVTGPSPATAPDLRRAPSMGSMQQLPPSSTVAGGRGQPPHQQQQQQQLVDLTGQIAGTGSSSNVPSRAHWDLKRKRDLRKSCPVQMMADIHSAHELVHNGEVKPPADSPPSLMTTSLELHSEARGEVLPEEEEHQRTNGVAVSNKVSESAAHLVKEAAQLIQRRDSRSASKDRLLSSDDVSESAAIKSSREHVIDDDSPSSPVGRRGASDVVPPTTNGARDFSSGLIAGMSERRRSPKRSPHSSNGTRRPSAPTSIGSSQALVWGETGVEDCLTVAHKSASTSTLATLEKAASIPEVLSRVETCLHVALRCCDCASTSELEATRPHLSRIDGLFSKLRTKYRMPALVPVDSVHLVEPLLSDIGDRICSAVQRRLSLHTTPLSAGIGLEDVQDAGVDEEEEEEDLEENNNSQLRDLYTYDDNAGTEKETS